MALRAPTRRRTESIGQPALLRRRSAGDETAGANGCADPQGGHLCCSAMRPDSIRRGPWPYVGLACSLAFVILAALVLRRGGLAFDEPLAAAIRALPIPVAFWEACTFLGGDVLVPIGGALVLVAVVPGRIRLAIIVAVALIIAALFTDAVKEFVARPRPPDPLVVATGYSFPSGHTLNSTVTYGLAAVLAWRMWHPDARELRGGQGSIDRRRLAGRARRLAVVAGVAIPFLVGLSRVALGVHWPTDVLGGWLAGTALVAAAVAIIDATGAMERDLPRGGERRGLLRETSGADRPPQARAPAIAGVAPTSRPPTPPARRRRGRGPRE